MINQGCYYPLSMISLNFSISFESYSSSHASLALLMRSFIFSSVFFSICEKF